MEMTPFMKDQSCPKPENEPSLISLKQLDNSHRKNLIALLTLGICIVFVLGIGIGFGIARILFVLNHSEITDQTPQPIVENCQSCENDGFSTLTYIANGSTKSLNYIMTKKMNFSNAVEKCLSLSADLWGIKDGETEWQAMVEILMKNPTMDAWINGNVSETYSPIEIDLLKEEAKKGNGLKVFYMNSSYSRLYKYPQQTKNCLYVENTKGLLWSVGYCGQEERPGICVKRNCCL